MPLVSVWKCPQTGKLFENKSKYIKHLRNIGIERRIKRQKEVYRNEWDCKIQELSLLPTEHDIIAWIENHSKLLLLNEINHGTFRTHVPKCIDTFRIKITSLGLYYDSTIACTHSAPKGKQTNWFRDSSLPTHFPGFRGHLEYGVSDADSRFGFSGLWKDTGIRTASGSSWKDFIYDGVKYKGFHFDVTLWEDDWPGLKMYRAMTLEE
jgi:hypothetical protein